MSSAARAERGAPPFSLQTPSPKGPAGLAERLVRPGCFARTVACHLLLVRPIMLAELERWRDAALQIPDGELRGIALASLQKRGNIEGAALLATLAPPSGRRNTVKAQVAFQALYNYLDALSEEPSEDPRALSAALHRALLQALGACSLPPETAIRRPDGAYIAELARVCRDSFAALPSQHLVAQAAQDAAGRILEFQVLNLPYSDGGHAALESWARELAPPGSGLRWWETAAGAGSSLAVHALLAAAASPGLRAEHTQAIESAYFPWVGALHSLLDSLVDRGEDAALGRPSLLDAYQGRLGVLTGLTELAHRAREATRLLPAGESHGVILTAMCSYYLSAPEAHDPEGLAVTASLQHLLGTPLRLAIWMFDAKRLVHNLSGRPFL